MLISTVMRDARQRGVNVVGALASKNHGHWFECLLEQWAFLCDVCQSSSKGLFPHCGRLINMFDFNVW